MVWPSFLAALISVVMREISAVTDSITLVARRGLRPRLAPACGAEQAAELTPAEKGKKIFSANCATCHQANGLGVAGQYPPLAGSEIVNGGSRRPVMIVLKGLQGPLTVKGQHYGSAVMQPWEKTLNDQKIADVLTYVRQEWGNTAGPVSAEGVAALAQRTGGRAESWTEPDILAVPADAELPGGPRRGRAVPGRQAGRESGRRAAEIVRRSA